MSTLASHTVDVVAGDGIGLEVMPAAIACVDALANPVDQMWAASMRLDPLGQKDAANLRVSCDQQTGGHRG